MSDRTVTPIEDVTPADFTSEADITFELDGGQIIITARRSWYLDVTEDFIPDDIRQSETSYGAAYGVFREMDWLSGREWFGPEVADMAREVEKATDYMGEALVTRAAQMLAAAFKAIRLADAIVREAS